MYIRKNIMLIIASLGLLLACSEDKDSSSQSSVELDSLTDTAWLNKSLPQETMGYLRIPSLWFAFTGQQNGFQYAQGNSAHVGEIKKIQAAVHKLLSDQVDSQARPVIDLLLTKLNGPLEVAVVPQSEANPIPFLVLATSLDFASMADFKDNFASSLSLVPGIQIVKPTSDDGEGRLIVNGLGIWYHYDDVKKQYKAIVGMGPAFNAMQKVNNEFVSNKQHLMLEAEQRVDSSEVGLFAWLNPQKILSIMAITGMQGPEQELKKTGLDKADAIALGYGVSNGKTRLKLLLDMPTGIARQFIPSINNVVKVTSVGQPKSAALLSIPTGKMAEQIFAAMDSFQGSSSSSLEMFNQEVNSATDLSFIQLLDMLGPEVIYFEDDIGKFVATSLNNKQHMEQLIEKNRDNANLDYQVRTVSGVKIHHLKMPLSVSGITESMPANSKVGTLQLLENLNSHFYWIEEDGYLLYSSVPQPLLERAKRSDRHSINDWLVNNQQQDFSNALFAYSTSIGGMSRNSYHLYLELLSLLADFSQADFDLLVLPTADQLNFAESGAIGFQLDIGERYLGAELSFEQSVTDVFYAGGMSSVAIIGILSAIAIPAYQDYVTRAEQYAQPSSELLEVTDYPEQVQ